MTITKMADIYENILICPFPFINMQGLWSGMLVGTLLQTVILVLITFRTKWQKEVILSQLYLCNLGPNKDNVLCMLVKISSYYQHIRHTVSHRTFDPSKQANKISSPQQK